MDNISGHIDNILFNNKDNDFIIARLKQKDNIALIPILGTMPSIQPGEEVDCLGKWVNHKKYGKQFLVESYTVKAPSDVIGIQKYLESGLIQGIGPQYAKNIVEKFKEETLEIIDKTPKKLLKVPGIGKKRVAKIIQSWEEQRSIRDVMIFLRSLDISPAFAQKIYKKYENASISCVRENPYRLAREVTGIGFKIADDIAKKMGFEKFSKKRIEAGIEHTFFELLKEGHTCYKKEEFILFSKHILDVEIADVETVLATMIEKKAVIEHFLGDKNFVFLNAFFTFESQIAKELLRISSAPYYLRKFDAEKAITWVQKILNLTLEEKQKEAIKQAVTSKVHIITGGPGTGKSTITKAILEITKKLTNNIVLAAPTGRAAKRLSWITHKKAFTIHALLEFDFIKKTFKKNKDNPIKADLIIIDEASMIDTFLMDQLLNAIQDKTKLLFVGDIDQLPSVGPGHTLKDMIDSKKIGVTELKEIFRQAKNSKIITNAHKINNGFPPDLKTPVWSDFQFIEQNDPEMIKDKILDTLDHVIKKYKFNIDTIQILAPMKKGIIGTENLNVILQQKINPNKEFFIRGNKKFHLLDKVMQIKNNYNKNIFNGDIGKITKIDKKEEKIEITFERRIIQYDFLELDEVALAYAVSVHKYQGSECPCIIMPIHTTHFKLLYRNLLYTAITRGKKLVYLIGSKKAIFMAIKNSSALQRYTGLKQKIIEC